MFVYPINLVRIYYLFVLLSFLYILIKSKFKKDGLYLILIFWQGLFSYFNYEMQEIGFSFNIDNLYKIIIFIYSIFLYFPFVLKKENNNDILVNLSFGLFSVVFWISYLLNGGNLITALSQYFYRYSILFLIYHGYKGLYKDNYKYKYIINLVINIIFIQVILSIIKLFIFLPLSIKTGMNIEFIVGSLSSMGAGIAVVLPIIALIFYWAFKGQDFKSKDYLYAFSFLIISLASWKRSTIFWFPFILLLLQLYTKYKINIITLIRLFPLAFIITYLGVRINPAINPEQKWWGSFDFQYLKNYILEYNFGVSDISSLFSKTYQKTQRGGSFLLLFNPSKMDLDSPDKLLFGHGIIDVVTLKYGRFVGSAEDEFSGYDLEHEGLIGKATNFSYSIGYLGFLSILFFSLSILAIINNKRLRYIILLYYFWELFFYGGFFILLPQTMIIFMLVYILVYINNKQSSIIKYE